MDKLRAKVFLAILMFSVLASLIVAFHRQPTLLAASVFADGFESGDGSAWTANQTSNGSFEVNTDYPYDGFYSGKFTTNALASGVTYARVYEDFTPGSEFYARAYVYITEGLPLADDNDRFTFIQFWNGSSMMCSCQVRHNNGEDKFCMVGFGTGTDYTTEVYPQMNQWYCVEFYEKVHATEGALKVWIDGVLRISDSGKNTTNPYNGATTLSRASFGNSYSNNVQQDVVVYADNCVIDTSYIGPEEEPPPESIFNDGFESGSFSAWNGTTKSSGETAEVVTTDPHHGNYHAEFSTNGNGMWEQAHCYVILNTTYSNIYTRAYYKFLDTLPTQPGGAYICSPNLRNHANDKAVVYLRVLNVAGTNYWSLYYMDGATGKYQTSSTTVSLNIWYSVEVHVKVHGTEGEASVWIEGVRIIHLTGLDTDEWGGVDYLQYGERASSEYVAHRVHLDCVVVDDSYIGPEGAPPAPGGEWGLVVAPRWEVPYGKYYEGIRNLFEEQEIEYTIVYNNALDSYDDISTFEGLVLFTDGVTEALYNVPAVKQFAETKPVLINCDDFCRVLYPSLPTPTQHLIHSIEYVTNWGGFKSGDQVGFNDDKENADHFVDGCQWANLNALGNVSQIAKIDATYSAYWYMTSGTNTGYYCLDLAAVSNVTLFAGIYHVFPVIELVNEVKVGQYARWLADDTDHWTYAEVMAWCTDWANAAPSGMNVSWVKIGESVQAKDINATFIGNGSRYIIVDGCIHGNEKFATTTLLGFLEEIEESYTDGAVWANRLAEITMIIVPILNPDGYSSNSRTNANGVDLNRQFPPGATTTEPEAWTMRWLWGNYTPVLYINLHEGRYYEPNTVIYSNYMPTTPNDVKSFTITSCYNFKAKFEDLNHWGLYKLGGITKDIGTTGSIAYGGINSMAIQGIGVLHHRSGLLLECIAWSPDHKAREMCYCMDWYITFCYETTLQYDHLFPENFTIVTNGRIKSFSFADNVTKADLDMTDLKASASTKIDIGTRAKPLQVKIDTEVKDEGDGWNYADGIITVSVAAFRIELSWQTEEPEEPDNILTNPYVTVPLTAFAVGGGATLAYYGYRKLKKAKKTSVD